ncbi:hypothetical protein [Polaribacter sp. KT25b]|uniref:hypothetical protein n=1 Tax=Polaribacter sp. KT25b TaxID=1855336 RepID=UPI000B845043|nr:hypothetical protein [Polaribacter sp. KT25b]
MKKINLVYLTHLLLIIFAFNFQSCASKKSKIIVNEKVVTKKYDNHNLDKNILYLIDGKEVSANDIKKLKPENIASLNVIKNKKEVAKYTNKKINGVIIIKLKK